MAKFDKEIQRQLCKARKIMYFKQREVEDMQEAQSLSDLLLALQEKGGQISQANMKMFSNIQKLVHQRGQAQRAKQLEIPDHLACPITFDIMKDPVMLMSGHTYERVAIAKHLS